MGGDLHENRDIVISAQEIITLNVFRTLIALIFVEWAIGIFSLFQHFEPATREPVTNNIYVVT